MRRAVRWFIAFWSMGEYEAFVHAHTEACRPTEEINEHYRRGTWIS